MHVRIILCYIADWTRDVLHVMQPGWPLDTDMRSAIYQLMNIWIIQWMNKWWISYYHMICNFKRILCLQICGNMFCKKYSLWIFLENYYLNHKPKANSITIMTDQVMTLQDTLMKGERCSKHIDIRVLCVSPHTCLKNSFIVWSLLFSKRTSFQTIISSHFQASKC